MPDFDPKTDEELDREMLLDPGTYDADVIEIEKKDSKKGDPMFALKLECFTPDGEKRHIYDYISPHWFHHKFKHFYASAGKLDVYDKGTMDAGDFVEASVSVVVDVQAASDQYPAKNIVVDYVVPTAETKKKTKSKPKPKDDDDLPF